MNNTPRPVQGGELFVTLRPAFLSVLRLLDAHTGRLLSVTLDGRAIHDWALDRIAVGVGALRPDRVLFVRRDDPDDRLARPLREVLRRACLQANIPLAEVPEINRLDVPTRVRVTVTPKDRDRPNVVQLWIRRLIRRHSFRLV